MWDFYFYVARIGPGGFYGRFRDPPGNLIEFEVITNQPGGVGGMWFNNVRHREIHIELVMIEDQTFDICSPAGTRATSADNTA